MGVEPPAHLLRPPIRAGDRALSDEEVVERIRAGETALFEILMRRHNQRLFRVTRSVLRDDSEAEDAVQQAYLLAYMHLGQFLGDARFSTWLTRIALNEAFARSRRRTRLAEVDGAYEGAELERRRPGPSSPEDETSTRQLTAVLEAAIDDLPEIYRVVVVMREVQELSTAETASCLGLGEEAVKVRLHRARGMLRDAMVARLESKARGAFSFLGERCDRIVEAVFAQLAALAR